MKAHLMGLIKQGLSLVQVMAHHKVYVREHALQNELDTWDTFVLPFDIRNFAKKNKWMNYGKNIRRTYLM